MTFPLAYALPLGTAGVSLAAYCVWRLIGLVQRSFVSRFPIEATPRVTLAGAGTFALGIETPRMTLADRGMGPLTMKATIRDIETNREVPMRPDFTGASVSGFSRTRRPLFKFHVDRPGSYEFDISGIPDREGLARCRFVLSRPLGVVIVPLILGIIVGTGGLIASVVLPLALRDTTALPNGRDTREAIDPLAASRVDSCLDGVEASCEGLAELADRRCAEGDADGCHVLGLLESQGRGTPANLPHAAQLFQLACDGGVAIGCVNLGWALQHGQGVAVDADRAALAFQQACDRNLGLGCHNLGVLHYELERATDAIEAFQRACDLAYLSACHNLGEMLLQRSEQGDRARAGTLYRQACDAGLEVSCQALKTF